LVRVQLRAPNSGFWSGQSLQKPQKPAKAGFFVPDEYSGEYEKLGSTARFVLVYPARLIGADWMTTCAVPATATCQLFDAGFPACAGELG
jgi:hypothetical protein